MRNKLYILLTAVLLLTSCNSDETVKFHRLEQLLFTTPTNQLPDVMKTHQEEYNTELISFYPDEPEFVQMTQEFVSDPVTRDIFHITDSLYHDISDIERQLGRALARAYKLSLICLTLNDSTPWLLVISTTNSAYTATVAIYALGWTTTL